MAKRKKTRRKTGKRRRRGGRKARRNVVKRSRPRRNAVSRRRKRRNTHVRSGLRGNPSGATAGTKLKNFGKSHAHAAIPVLVGGGLLFVDDMFIDRILLKLPGTPGRNEPIGMGYRALSAMLLGMGIDLVTKNKKAPGTTYGELFRNVLYIKIAMDAAKRFIGPRLRAAPAPTPVATTTRTAAEFIPGDVAGVQRRTGNGIGRGRVREF